MAPTEFERVTAQRLRDDGLQIEHLYDLESMFDRVPARAISAILENLDLIETPIEAHDVAYLLQRPEAPFDGRPLAALYDRIDSDFSRGPIALTLWLASPTHVDTWIEHTLQRVDYGVARTWLAPAFAMRFPAEQVLPILAGLIDEIPSGVIAAWAICGGESELARIERESAKYEAAGRLRAGDPLPSIFLKDDLKKAASQIRRRLRKAADRISTDRLAPALHASCDLAALPQGDAPLLSDNHQASSSPADGPLSPK